MILLLITVIGAGGKAILKLSCGRQNTGKLIFLATGDQKFRSSALFHAISNFFHLVLDFLHQFLGGPLKLFGRVFGALLHCLRLRSGLTPISQKLVFLELLDFL